MASFAIIAIVLVVSGYLLSSHGGYSNLVNNQAPAATLKSHPGVGDSEVIEMAGGSVPAQTKPKSAPPASKGSSAKSGEVGPDYERVKATFVTLARNSDLDELLGSIRSIEDRFNHRYHYDWVFLNDQPFSEEFKSTVSALVSGTTKFGLIPQEHWSYPSWIDQEKAAASRQKMIEKKVIYGGSEPYRHMCRFESGFFWRQEVLAEYDYYWRVEPSIKIYCDVDYDVFKFMKESGKDYGFTITLPEYIETVPTLWDTVKSFIHANPQYLAENNLMEWISNDNGATYNMCHFWSNFEVGNLNFWRSEAYQKFFEHLDKAGGFFYERWGDAPVHSIAAALFLPREKVHFFGDVGYYHVPFHNCPIDQEVRTQKKCVCNTKDDFTWKKYSCTTKFFDIQGLTKPQGWEAFHN
ncbi:Glycolipid 2-alpha-mannosyltransferase 1 [Scheffersomyces spartinae]|uniref:Glycolipid 2-alpha-mannosyltransferase 1 n=1 Tax=Scheffersomyces spartinae TaxID=45513 RepID=A0A9P7VAG8_9ASCO|nr:Glycolipid 2-alpha-mannosyltransferase 1 [Scheffersomyces spartinae]KAG7194344.1 Glycolipid 2-alpha-mannosyltransferase 1 [Scheffersomyces spartinae]